MANLSMIEKRKFEDLFGMSSGYVLDFSNERFAELFRTACRLDIYDSRYSVNGDSKAKRLRCFWEIESDRTVGTALRELLNFWQHVNSKPQEAESALFSQCEIIVGRLLGHAAPKKESTVEIFLKVNFGDVKLEELNIEPSVISILSERLSEAVKCQKSDCNLAVVFHCGSVLEGLLLGAAIKNPKAFNETPCSPKKDGKVKHFQDWKLGEFIDVAYDLRLLSLDVKKFSHVLRDFRNYIHPYEQLASKFSPDRHTAAICLQVLRAAIASLTKAPSKNGE